MKTLRSLCSLALFFLAVLCMPESAAQKIREIAMDLPPAPKNEKALSIEMENALLRREIQRLAAWLQFEKETEDEIEKAKQLLQHHQISFFERRSHYLLQNINRRLKAAPARVIFREPLSWSSQIWLNVGEKDNREMGGSIIAVGSAVLSDRAAIGVVEEVTESRCRVRLITDPHLPISVRCVRGGEQDGKLLRECEALAAQLKLRDEVEGACALASAVSSFAKTLAAHEQSDFLAKGVLRGAGHPLWRSLGQTLKGEGFNYDFPDEEGPSRDLRTGSVNGEGKAVALICVGDLLVTTGLDGVFPPDLPVATVTKIHPLNEGGCSYNLEARSCATQLNRLADVLVLPPL